MNFHLRVQNPPPQQSWTDIDRTEEYGHYAQSTGDEQAVTEATPPVDEQLEQRSPEQSEETAERAIRINTEASQKDIEREPWYLQKERRKPIHLIINAMTKTHDDHKPLTMPAFSDKYAEE